MGLLWSVFEEEESMLGRNGSAGRLLLSKSAVTRPSDARRGDMADLAKCEADSHLTGLVSSVVQNHMLSTSQQERVFFRRVQQGVQDICVDCRE